MLTRKVVCLVVSHRCRLLLVMSPLLMVKMLRLLVRERTQNLTLGLPLAITQIQVREMLLL